MHLSSVRRTPEYAPHRRRRWTPPRGVRRDRAVLMTAKANSQRRRHRRMRKHETYMAMPLRVPSAKMSSSCRSILPTGVQPPGHPTSPQAPMTVPRLTPIWSRFPKKKEREINLLQTRSVALSLGSVATIPVQPYTRAFSVLSGCICHSFQRSGLIRSRSGSIFVNTTIRGRSNRIEDAWCRQS